MAAPHELLVVQTKDRIIRVQKVGVENNLDPIVACIKELDSSDLVEDGVVGIVRHVMCSDWGE